MKSLHSNRKDNSPHDNLTTQSSHSSKLHTFGNLISSLCETGLSFASYSNSQQEQEEAHSLVHKSLHHPNHQSFLPKGKSKAGSKSKGIIGNHQCHHRPRIKLKSYQFRKTFSLINPSSYSFSLPLPTFSLNRIKNQINTKFSLKSCPKLLTSLTTMIYPKSINHHLIKHLTTLTLLIFGLNSLIIPTVPGACASSITINNNSNQNSEFLSYQSQRETSEFHLLNQLVNDLNQEEINLNHQDQEEEEQLKQKSELDNSNNSKDNPILSTNYDEVGSDNFIDKSINSISNSKDSIRTENQDNVNDKSEISFIQKIPPPLTESSQDIASTMDIIILNLRPVPHFSVEQTSSSSSFGTEAFEEDESKVNIKEGNEVEFKEQEGKSKRINKTVTTIAKISQSQEGNYFQADQPSYQDNKGSDHDPILPPSQKVSVKSIKPHKSKPLPQPLNPGANDPHELSHQVIIIGKSIIPSHPFEFDEHHGTHSNPNITPIPFNYHHYHQQQQNNNNNKSRIVSVTKNTNNTKTSQLKPRRLDTLSHGIKNRIQNSIFEEEPESEGSEGASAASSSSSGLSKTFPNLEKPKEIRYKNASLSFGLGSNPTGSGSSSASLPTYRRSPLQIRRDLSRLVANVATGNGIDDDIGSLSSKCDRLYISTPNGTRNGTFESPTLFLEEGHLYQCIFMFVARPDERVEISFKGFKVRGTPPECGHEWVDIWTEVEGTDPTDLITTPFSGRYCGKIPPRKRISLYGGIAIGFYSDKNVTDETIFYGSYAFINESRYIVGTPVPRTLCSYTILASSNKGVGELLSPTYPGVYPKNLSCSYKFIGSIGQRIRIEFRDFDVFFGGVHCPFDDVKVYDGFEPTSRLIGTYCGQQRNLVIYSSEHMMLVTFTTLDRNTDSQNRGFSAVYEFSNSFVKLDFIEKNMGDHIRGTECDQRILSKSRSSGVIYSPNYPFPYLPKIVCRYFIYGLQDPQNLERVRLSFEIFDVPSNTNSAEDEVNQSDAKRCGDGFLKIYLKGQEVIQAYDKADYEFCGKEIPHAVVSDGPRLVLVFSSGETQGSGFKAKYIFETEYRIPGTESPDGCHFTYYSSSRQKGEFNSPRFPSNYPSQTNCTYIFIQKPNEQVRIVFDNFKLKADKFNYTDRGAYGSSCDEDWVEIWNVMSSQDDRLVGRYCGTTAPGPIESKEKAEALKVIMWTDEEGVYSGFKARYTYFTADSVFGTCGRNISELSTGLLTSPKWPGKYEGPAKQDASAACNWYLNVRPGSRVMLYFQSFSIEGEPAGRGCPAAAIRIWEDPEGVPIELCGETLLPENKQYVSLRNAMRVTFITADKSVGAPGFQAIWTEVQDGASGVPCHPSYFRCTKTQFCIPTDLRCDGAHNCGFHNGTDDRSDEEECGLEFGDMNLVFTVGVGIAISLFVIIIVCAWGQRRRRRRRRRLQLRRPPIHVCDNAGARFAAMDSV